ncbi:glycosyltransferase family 2 protein [Nakamurella leprariae]|uniref:Glycosyltransferase family 2 protein n=1 Tax=Nakamurella leprariae TaxID=2803911 RepID=A0A938YH37_9ACTN|nr:glycosyltransferase family 2 protein [Nakamurella leprariae]MBM9467718.1 glycosyltransferase family 2 protein [Nakamurella leprariae]
MTIDVMLPAYGNVDLLRRAISSVVEQRSTDWRLVVVDDASPGTDLTDLVTSFGDERIEYVRNPANLGINGNFRRCAELVHAPVAVIMGADDEMLPNHLTLVADAMTAHPDAAVVEVGVTVIDEDGRETRPLADRVKGWIAPSVDARTVLGGEPLAASLLRGNWTYFPSLAWNTTWLRRIGFRPGLEVALDLVLLLDIVAAGGSMVLDPTPAFRYRRHRASYSSVSAADGARFDEEAAVYRGAADAFTALGWPTAARAARRHLLSRAHAAMRVPAAIRAGDRSGSLRLSRFALGR